GDVLQPEPHAARAPRRHDRVPGPPLLERAAGRPGGAEARESLPARREPRAVPGLRRLLAARSRLLGGDPTSGGQRCGFGCAALPTTISPSRRLGASAWSAVLSRTTL